MRFQYVLQAQGDVGILCCIFIDVGRGEVAHIPLFLAFRTEKFLDVDGPVAEQRFCHIVHVVMEFRLDEVVGDHRVEHLSL